MKKGFSDVERYVYIKTLAELAGKFKVGDYVKYYQIQEYDEETGDDFEIPKFMANSYVLESIRKYNGDYVQAKVEMIYKVVVSDAGYIELEAVDMPDKKFPMWSRSVVVTGYTLVEEIENFMYSSLGRGKEPEEVVNYFVENYLKLDEDYSDSIIMDYEYEPYKNSSHHDQLDAVKAERNSAERQRRSEAAKKGHQTRRERKKQEKAAALARAKAAKAAANKAKKKKTVVTYSKTTKKKK